MFSISGIFSGLDVNALVDTLVEAERAPAEARYARRESAYNVELSALGQLKASLSAFETQLNQLNSAADLNPRSAGVSDESILAVTTSSTAVPGSYQFYVDQLATRHQVTSGDFASDARFGSGAATLTVNGASFTINIAAGTDSLSDIRDAINNAQDNTGVQAVIINDGTQQRLLLTSENSGAANTVSADFSALSGGTTSLTSFTDLQQAGDAQIRFGFGCFCYHNHFTGQYTRKCY